MPFRRLPSLLAMRAFEAVARNGSMKNAAEELSVTPGAVSQLVRKLETELDCELLHRANRRLDLTAEGISLSKTLSQAFLNIKDAVAEISTTTEQAMLQVACAPAFAAKWLVPRLSSFITLHPDIEIRIISCEVAQDYHAKQVDIGINLGSEIVHNIHQHWLGEETMMVMASPEFIARQKLREPRDIMRVPLLTESHSAQQHGAPGWREWFLAAGLPEKAANRGVNFGQHVEQALDAAIAGAGVVLGRKVLASKALDAGQLICPFGPTLNTGLSYQVLCRKAIKHSDQAIAFQQWLEAELSSSINACSTELTVAEPASEAVTACLQNALD